MGSKKPWDERRIRLQQQLRALRDEAGLTQTALAALLNDDQSFVSRYERGERRLDLIELADICAACGCTLSQFTTRYEFESRPKGTPRKRTTKLM